MFSRSSLFLYFACFYYNFVSLPNILYCIHVDLHIYMCSETPIIIHLNLATSFTFFGTLHRNFVLFFFSSLFCNAEQTKPSSLFLFLFQLFSLPMRSKPNRRLCIFYWFQRRYLFLAHFRGDNTDDLRYFKVWHWPEDNGSSFLVPQAGRWRVSLQVGQLGVLGRVAVLRSDSRQVQGRAHNCVNFLRKIIAFSSK